jgi:hypothetical protein
VANTCWRHVLFKVSCSVVWRMGCVIFSTCLWVEGLCSLPWGAEAISCHDYRVCVIVCCVQSVYEDVARDTNRGHTVEAVKECFCQAKDAGFKVRHCQGSGAVYFIQSEAWALGARVQALIRTDPVGKRDPWCRGSGADLYGSHQQDWLLDRAHCVHSMLYGLCCHSPTLRSVSHLHTFCFIICVGP